MSFTDVAAIGFNTEGCVLGVTKFRGSIVFVCCNFFSTKADVETDTTDISELTPDSCELFFCDVDSLLIDNVKGAYDADRCDCIGSDRTNFSTNTTNI